MLNGLVKIAWIHGDYAVIIQQDEDAGDPRQDWDNVGHLMAWLAERRNWTYIGDKDYRMDFPRDDDGEFEPEQALYDLLGGESLDDFADSWGWDADNAWVQRLYYTKRALWLNAHAVWLVKTYQGYNTLIEAVLFMPRKDVEREYGAWTEETRQKALQVLKGEWALQTAYWDGEVYGYTIYRRPPQAEDVQNNAASEDDELYEDDADRWEDGLYDWHDAEEAAAYVKNTFDDVDSCWGFYGETEEDSGILSEVASQLDYLDPVVGATWREAMSLPQKMANTA